MQPISNELLQELVMEQLNISLRGTIITAGFCRSPEVLQAAGNVPIKGLILGSLASELIPLAKSLDYPILVIDGFGSKPMNKAAEAIIVTNKDRNVALNAQVSDLFSGDVPELIISLSGKTDAKLPDEAATLRSGKRVIIVNGKQANQIGTIESIRPGKQRLPNGIATKIAVVALANDKKANVPLANLEILN
jgi:hypothetical protein